LIIAVVAGVAACGGTSVSPSGARSTGVMPADSSPASGESPQPTAWPGQAVLAINALGAGDNEIAKAIADFSEATANEDLVRMRGAAIGLQNLLTGLSRSVDQVAAYPPMAPMAAEYRAALASMQTGAKALVTAIDAGDARGIVDATSQITIGMRAYGPIRAELADWVDQATRQQRLLVK
jgi:hypothetical protein